MTQPMITSSTTAGSMTGPVAERVERVGREVDGVPAAQGPVALPERCAHRLDDHRLAHMLLPHEFLVSAWRTPPAPSEPSLARTAPPENHATSMVDFGQWTEVTEREIIRHDGMTERSTIAEIERRGRGRPSRNCSSTSRATGSDAVLHAMNADGRHGPTTRSTTTRHRRQGGGGPLRRRASAPASGCC